MATPPDVAYLYQDRSIKFLTDGGSIEVYTDWYYKNETKQMALNLCRLTQGDSSQPVGSQVIDVYDGTHELLLAHTDSGGRCQAG